jgi:hypothetical protein
MLTKAENRPIVSSDVPEVEQDALNILDPELTDFCERWDIPMRLNRPCDGGDSDSSLSSEGEDPQCLDEIVEQSDLEKFCAFLKKAQIVALEAERANGTTRRTYTGKSRTTKYRRKKDMLKPKARGIQTLDKYITITKPEAKKRHTTVREESEESSDSFGTPRGSGDCTQCASGDSHAGSDSEGCCGSEDCTQGSSGHGSGSKGPRESGDRVQDGGGVGCAGSGSEGHRGVGCMARNCVGDRGSSDLDSEGQESLPGSAASHTEIHTLREEEEESEERDVSPQDKHLMENLHELTIDGLGSEGDETEGPGPARALLEDLRRGLLRVNLDTPQTNLDNALEVLSDRSMLHAASETLSRVSKDKKIDVLFRARIVSMVGTLNLFLDPGLLYTWRKASLISSKAQGRGISHARRIREWILKYLRHEELPLHRLGQTKWTALEDEDIAREIKLRLTENTKGTYLKAADVANVIASPEIQEIFRQKGICKPSISDRTARRWLAGLGWRYGKMQNGMYIDGHEREDVVEYRREFVVRWKENERRFHQWDNDGNELPRPNGFPVPGAISRFRLIPVTHDESVFYQNDERTTAWVSKSDKPKPKPKGDGQSIMVSDFLTPDWGRLRDGDEWVFFLFSQFDHLSLLHRDARVLFKAGKNRDGWFGSDDLITQVDRAIDIFEGLTKGHAQGLFLFDNAPSHQKRAGDAISARKMVKGVLFCDTQPIFRILIVCAVPKEGWAHHSNGPRMRDGRLPNGETQSFYFPPDHPTTPGWFKGMEVIIRERGLWPADGLLAQCANFRCPPGKTDCCCRRLLFMQPDFLDQKPLLQEFVERRGHLCDFYPKYHCELNFIEQYWGAAKLRFRVAGRAPTIEEMEQKVVACLDDVPLIQIRR